jgi:hypothetical protein
VTRRLLIVVVLAVLAAVLLPSGVAFAQSASPDPCATVFDRVCDPAEQRGFNEEQTPLPPGADPPGAMLRSLIMIVLLAVLFFVYVGWALQRGTPRA